MQPAQQPMFFDTQGNLLIPGVHSPNYVAGATGWTINQDGSAEFNSLVVRGVFNGTNFIINSHGAFFYSGVPAFGNLVGSITQSSGNDTFGNPYLTGYTSYTSTKFANLNSGLIEIGFVVGGAPDQANASQINVISTDLLFQGPKSASLPSAVATDYLSGQSGVTVPGSTEPVLLMTALNQLSVASFQLSGAVTKTSLSGSPAVWQAPSYTANFAAASTGGNYQPLQYRLDAEDNLHLEGAFHSLASTTAATVFTLPVGFRPSVARAVPATSDNAAGTVQTMACFIQINSNGPVALHTSAATAISQNYYFNAVIPLGNIP